MWLVSYNPFVSSGETNLGVKIGYQEEYDHRKRPLHRREEKAGSYSNLLHGPYQRFLVINLVVQLPNICSI